MNKVHFAIALHFHQPVGNLVEILERACRNCYKPFLEAFIKYPSIKMTLHFSGNLLDYFQENHPEITDMVAAMSDRGQIEVMGGGYYEPIFQAIPQQDRAGQIEMLSSYSEKRFGVRPVGMWMPERVWSPDILPDFCRAGMKYSILDDNHLIRAGVGRDELYGYFVTSGAGCKIAIFPTDKNLRYMIPFKSPAETIRYFKKIAARLQNPLFIYGDDGEKFGEWPWTYDWVYKKGWLDGFFKELVKNEKWLRTVKFSDYLSSNKPIKEVFIPEGSYEEMMEWSGGSWMNYLKRYPEANQMHKRMVYVSERIAGLVKGEKLDEARRELYKGQCNCAYWHGVFGGIYLHNLRNAVYEHLIKAGRLIDEVENRDGKASIKKLDFYKNGKDAVILEDKNFFLCIDPAKGGVIRELDYKPKSANLINTLARRGEAYHKRIVERLHNRITSPLKPHEAIKIMDKRIKDKFFYDKYDRVCLIDHFIDKDLKKEDFENCTYIERDGFNGGSYDVAVKENRIILRRDCLTKEISILSDDTVRFSYIINMGGSRLFGVEFNIGLSYGDSERYSYEQNAGSFLIKDSQGGLGAAFYFSEPPARIWHYPVMAVSQSERAYDLTYQATCIFPMWDIDLKDGEKTCIDIDWKML